ncbi:MAG: cyclic nucleotide-binding domain-containing protein [Xanthobacteraceae bacterium]
MNDGWTVDYLLSFVTLSNMLGATGALFYVVSMSMKTVIPLRITSLVSAVCLLGASILSRSLPAILLYALLLPVHSFRLYQMLDLIKKVRAAVGTDLSMDWLRPYMKRRKYRKGDILFHKGDAADEMFLIANGKYRVVELDNELQPGQIFGELGLLTQGYHRTQSVECVESGQVLTLPYDELRALYFENPQFGFYFLQLASGRLLEDKTRAEEMLAAERAARAANAH